MWVGAVVVTVVVPVVPEVPVTDDGHGGAQGPDPRRVVGRHVVGVGARRHAGVLIRRHHHIGPTGPGDLLAVPVDVVTEGARGLVHEMVTVLPLTAAFTPVGALGVPVTAVWVTVGGLVVVGDGGTVPDVVVVVGAAVVGGADPLVVVVVAATVEVGAGEMLAPLPPPKSALNAANAFGKSPSVMSLSCPPAVSLNEKMFVNATLLVEIQLANSLMKYGSSPRPCPSLRKHTDHSGMAMGLPSDAAKLVSQLRPQLWLKMLAQEFCGVWGVPQYSS